MNDGRILVLLRCQVVDPARGCFFVGLEADDRSQHLGHQVYKDCFGRRLIIVDDGLGKGVAEVVHATFSGVREQLRGEGLGMERAA